MLKRITKLPLGGFCFTFIGFILFFFGNLYSQKDSIYQEILAMETPYEKLGPTNGWYGTKGTPQIFSAEPLGHGRLTFNVTMNNYTQENEFPGVSSNIVPTGGTDPDILTGIVSASYGVNPHVDFFAGGAYYGSVNWNADDASGPGSFRIGAQGSLPFLEGSPLRVAGQVAFIGGTSLRKIDAFEQDGYAYFETRTGHDGLVRLMQSILMGGDFTNLKLHFNQGVVGSIESGTPPLLLLGAGAEMQFFPYAVWGFGIRSRTSLKDIDIPHDPLWISNSLTFRTPWKFNVQLGFDNGLSQERDDNAKTKAVEDQRFYGGLTFTFDLWAQKRKEARARAIADSLARLEIEKKAKEYEKMSDSLAQKARQDSIQQAKLREQERLAEQAKMDSLSQRAKKDSLGFAERARRDSIAAAKKAKLDSIALAKAKQDSIRMAKELQKERAARSEAEREFLKTGVLALDAVYFETGKAKISINSIPYLKVIGNMLGKYPKLKLEIGGHTDNIGNDSYNMQLSQQRAEAVRQYFLQNFPDLGMRMTSRGYGETRPRAPNTTPEGRQLNRRTEITVQNKEILDEYK